MSAFSHPQFQLFFLLFYLFPFSILFFSVYKMFKQKGDCMNPSFFITGKEFFYTIGTSTEGKELRVICVLTV